MKPTSQKTAAIKTSLSKPPAKAAADAEAAKKRRQYAVAAAIAAFFFLAIWYWWPNAQLAKVRHMQEELFSAALSADEKKEKFEALRAEQEKLSPADRKEVRKDIGKLMQQKSNADAAKYLTLSAADKRKVIDDRIAREQAVQKKQATGAAKGGGGPGAGGPGAGGGGPGFGGGGQFAAAGQGKGPATPEARDDMRRQALLRGSADARAGMDQMKLDMAVRRAQLGLPPTPQKGIR